MFVLQSCLLIAAHLLLVHLTDFGVAQAAYTLHGDNIAKWYKTFKKAQVEKEYPIIYPVRGLLAFARHGTIMVHYIA